MKVKAINSAGFVLDFDSIRDAGKQLRPDWRDDAFVAYGKNEFGKISEYLFVPPKDNNSGGAMANGRFGRQQKDGKVINYFDNSRNLQDLTFDLDIEINEPNRRKEQRKACLIPAHYKIKRQLYSSFILDINEAGAFIETDRSFPIGEKVILKFLDPWSRRSALINGSIVWSSDAAIGIKFGYHLFTPFGNNIFLYQPNSNHQAINSITFSLDTQHVAGKAEINKYNSLIKSNLEQFFVQNCFQISSEVFMFDRRRFGRFQVAEEEYQLIRHSTGTIGWINDINLHGLSYEYIATDNQQVKLEDIGIISEKNRGSFLPSLSCRVIYDINVDEELDFHSIVHFRRCGLKYRSLTKGQKAKLLSLINSVTPIIFETVGERKG